MEVKKREIILPLIFVIFFLFMIFFGGFFNYLTKPDKEELVQRTNEYYKNRASFCYVSFYAQVEDIYNKNHGAENIKLKTDSSQKLDSIKNSNNYYYFFDENEELNLLLTFNQYYYNGFTTEEEIKVGYYLKKDSNSLFIKVYDEDNSYLFRFDFMYKLPIDTLYLTKKYLCPCDEEDLK